MSVTPEFFNSGDKDNYPGKLGIRILELDDGHSLLEMELDQSHMNYLNTLHGGAIVSLADTAAGYGTFFDLPENASGFTTIELKCNFMRGSQPGDVVQCSARRIHNGRTTQVWDASVTDESSGKLIAEFRCTNLILHSPK